jgi:hypothetical protein
MNPNASSFVPSWFGWGKSAPVEDKKTEPMETVQNTHIHSIADAPMVIQNQPKTVDPVITTTGSAERNILMSAMQTWLNSAPAWVKDEPIVNWEEVAKCDLNEDFILAHVPQLTPVVHVLALHVRLTAKILKAFESKWNWQSLLKNKTLTNDLLIPYYKQMDPNWLLPARKIPGDVILDNLQNWPLDLIFKTQKIDTPTAIIMMRNCNETGRAALLFQLLNNNRFDETFFQAVTEINPALLTVEQLIRGVKLSSATLDGLCKRATSVDEQRRLILQILQDQRPVPSDWMYAWAFQDWIVGTPFNLHTLLAAGVVPPQIIAQLMPTIVSQVRLILVYVANQPITLDLVNQLAIQANNNDLAKQVYLSALQNAIKPGNWSDHDIRELVKLIDTPSNVYKLLKDETACNNMLRVFPEIKNDPDTVMYINVKNLSDTWSEMTLLQKAIAIARTRKTVEEAGENAFTPTFSLNDVAKYWWRITMDSDGIQHVAAASTKTEAYKTAFNALTKEEWRQVMLASDPKNYLKPWVIDTMVACGYNKVLSDGVDFWWKIARYQPLSADEFRKYVHQGVVNPATVAENQLERWNKVELTAWLQEFGAFMEDNVREQLESAIRHKLI